MDDAIATHSSPAEVARLREQVAKYEALLAQREEQLAQATQQRDEFKLKILRLELRLAQFLKQAYGPRADRLSCIGQLLLDFAGHLDALPTDVAELLKGVEASAPAEARPRRLRTRGRRDLGELTDLPLIEQKYELTGEACNCPRCQQPREQIGADVSYTIDFVPGTFTRIKHIQCKYACRACEHDGFNPNIALGVKTGGSPIDKGMPGPGLLSFIAVSKFADYTPLHRLEGIFARQGFELDRSTMCAWMADVAALALPVYARMADRVRRAHVLATDDTVMPLLEPGKAKQARMWIYRGDDDHPYNVFDFTTSRGRDGPAQFLQGFSQVLLADAYGGYDGVVVAQELQRAGCWAHARRKFVDAESAGPELVRAVVHLINALFAIERRAKDLPAAERLRLRQVESQPALDRLRNLLIEQKLKLLPKHPLAAAVGYVLNQWEPLTLFTTDPAVPIDNNLAEQQMKRIALLRKNALFAATPHGGRIAAILSSLTSTCHRHGINPQTYLTQLLANARDITADQVDDWLPDRWKLKYAPPAEPASAEQ
ncbi:MAG: IS66 family transposase [Gammaproteobacteria bacterium]|nr:IS66 family transposase [Gammaproteobacteria bacterium]